MRFLLVAALLAVLGWTTGCNPGATSDSNPQPAQVTNNPPRAGNQQITTNAAPGSGGTNSATNQNQ